LEGRPLLKPLEICTRDELIDEVKRLRDEECIERNKAVGYKIRLQYVQTYIKDMSAQFEKWDLKDYGK